MFETLTADSSTTAQVFVAAVLVPHVFHAAPAVTRMGGVGPARSLFRGAAQGIVVAQLFALKPDAVDDFVKKADPIFASYRNAGAREAGVLVTLNANNNFPQLSFRTDGPFLVWLGILKDDEMLKGLTSVAERSTTSFNATALLRSMPELIVLDPTPRSRLRCLP